MYQIGSFEIPPYFALLHFLRISQFDLNNFQKMPGKSFIGRLGTGPEATCLLWQHSHADIFVYSLKEKEK